MQQYEILKLGSIWENAKIKCFDTDGQPYLHCIIQAQDFHLGPGDWAPNIKWLRIARFAASKPNANQRFDNQPSLYYYFQLFGSR